jgi:DNA-directed RNA polymerase subunit RPC12/RpoP
MRGMEFACPKCGATLTGDKADTGTEATCPACEHRFLVSKPSGRGRKRTGPFVFGLFCFLAGMGIAVGVGVFVRQRCGKAPQAYESIYDAANKGDLADVKRHLNSPHAVVNSKDAKGRTALLRAVEGGHRNVVRLLVSKGGDVNTKSQDNNTPLVSAACQGDLDMIKLLIKHGADPNVRGSNGGRPLICAITRSHMPVVEYLASNGAEVNGGDTPPLICAAKKRLNAHALCKILVAKGADVNGLDHRGCSPLVYANDDAVRGLLVTHGGRVIGEAAPFDPDTFLGRDPTTPVLISPKPGALLDNGRTDGRDDVIWRFEWEAVPDAKAYNLYVMGPTARIPLIDIVVSETAYEKKGEGRIVQFSGWEWSVRAKIGDEWGDWSPKGTFDVEPADTDFPSREPTKPKKTDFDDLLDRIEKHNEGQ